ncbi:UbiA family prenyltransferase [Phytopseudomonas dryadis]|uniref:UbiA family prenyltransferase n=1 Tax=Phytopseudomonas dryadis TaxID=2487520 RepID=A0A4Q9QY01_9GAMM|nr:UbiA family prenyltransferase [Pseudomonas dryadis]TBU87895.1 UbiA family prenyltransferase [Pseudomonas dryadis]
MAEPPLVIDLDGTLLRSDMLHEASLRFAKRSPWRIGSLFGWLTRGKAHLKEQLARQTPFEVEHLPYDPEVIELIEQHRSRGTSVVLATATHRLHAEKIAAHLQVFDRVFATEHDCNLGSKAKRDLLVREYGEKGFDYAGNAHADLFVWASANRAYVVRPHSGVERRAMALGNVVRVFKSDDHPLKNWLKALRLHQWLKNLLLFVPLFAAHLAGDPQQLLQVVQAFLLFGLCASSVYILNDLLDIDDDRRHPRKCTRPFAAGKLSIRAGLLVFPILLAASFIGAWLLLPPLFSVAMLAYYLLTLAYSLGLKRVMAVDVITLGLLYTLRIIAGAFALGLQPTFWMLAFSLFIFLSLALIKRYAELREARELGKTGQASGRGYFPADLEMISSIGTTSGYLSVLVLALYIQEISHTALYRYPAIIWLACPLLLFWVSRTWFLTHRGLMHDDPVVFAAKDRISLITGALFALVFWLAV